MQLAFFRLACGSAGSLSFSFFLPFPFLMDGSATQEKYFFEIFLLTNELVCGIIFDVDGNVIKKKMVAWLSW